MNAPINALAVLTALELQTLQRGGSPSWANIAQARAALAELIDVNQRIADRSHKKAGGGWWMVSNEDMAALRAALARVGGVK